MGKNHSSVVVLWIRPKFWWMLPMGVRDNHTKYEPQTQRWRPGPGVAPPFQNLQLRAKISLFLPKNAPEPAENGQMKGNSGYSTHAARLPRAEGPSTSLEFHNMSSIFGLGLSVANVHKFWGFWGPFQGGSRISWATWLKTRFRAHLIHPHPPTFGGFQPSKWP